MGSEKDVIYRTLGASNHTASARAENDFNATEPKAAELLLDLFPFSKRIWECACGAGHLSKVFESRGHEVVSTDLFDRGYGTPGVNFLNCTEQFDGDIITNPPYKYAQQFAEKALELVHEGHHAAMFLKLTFMEGQKRKAFFAKSPPKIVFVSSSRLQCAKNGDFQGLTASGGSAVAYGWYVWEKGFDGETRLKWFN